MSLRRLAAGSAVLVLLASMVAACGDGGVSLPTRLPTALPTLTRPAQDGGDDGAASDDGAAPDDGAVTDDEVVADEAAPDESPQDSTRWWLWLLAGVVVIGGLLGGILPGRLRRNRWDEEAAGLRAEVARLDAEIVPDVLVRATTAEAAIAWQASGAWRFDLDRRLAALAAVAPDAPRRTRAEAWHGALAALVVAVDGETSTPSAAGADVLRARRTEVEQARRGLRAALAPQQGPAAP